VLCRFRGFWSRRNHTIVTMAASRQLRWDHFFLSTLLTSKTLQVLCDWKPSRIKRVEKHFLWCSNENHRRGRNTVSPWLSRPMHALFRTEKCYIKLEYSNGYDVTSLIAAINHTRSGWLMNWLRFVICQSAIVRGTIILSTNPAFHYQRLPGFRSNAFNASGQVVKTIQIYWTAENG
jgi:hypothetical protein